MTERLRKRLDQVLALKRKLDQSATAEDSFANSLANRSLTNHIDDLTAQISMLDSRPTIELIELRLNSQKFQDGSVPLRFIAKAAEEIRQMMGFAALRLSRGGLDRKRIPAELYDELDLRLTGVLPGSSRLIITTAANRDLLDDGLSKHALDRVFSVLESDGRGAPFLEAITDLGPRSARRLRDLLHLVQDASAELDLSWRYSGETVRQWIGTKDRLSSVTHALDVTEINSKEEVILTGLIELLSKRERIHLRTEDSKTIRVLFPIRLLPRVAELHLEQSVVLRCSVTETLNPHTGETSTFYDLLEITA